MASSSTPRVAEPSCEDNLLQSLLESGLGGGPAHKGIVPSPADTTIASVLVATTTLGNTLLVAREPTIYADSDTGMLLMQGMEPAELERAAQWATSVSNARSSIPVLILVTPTLSCLHQIPLCKL